MLAILERRAMLLYGFPEPVFISHIAVNHASPRLLFETEIATAPQNVSLWTLRPGVPYSSNILYSFSCPVFKSDSNTGSQEQLERGCIYDVYILSWYLRVDSFELKRLILSLLNVSEHPGARPP
jgi:hypothetical protein